jgi:transposase InsO family protein
MRLLRQTRNFSSDGPRRTILAGTLARSSSTFRALIDLVADGFGPQAGMLARTMIEDAEVACWAAVHSGEDELRRLWIDHFDRQQLRLQPSDSTELPVGMTPERTEALPEWLEYYKTRRRHQALGGRAPISRLSPMR